MHMYVLDSSSGPARDRGLSERLGDHSVGQASAVEPDVSLSVWKAGGDTDVAAQRRRIIAR